MIAFGIVLIAIILGLLSAPIVREWLREVFSKKTPAPPPTPTAGGGGHPPTPGGHDHSHPHEKKGWAYVWSLILAWVWPFKSKFANVLWLVFLMFIAKWVTDIWSGWAGDTARQHDRFVREQVLAEDPRNWVWKMPYSPADNTGETRERSDMITIERLDSSGITFQYPKSGRNVVWVWNVGEEFGKYRYTRSSDGKVVERKFKIYPGISNSVIPGEDWDTDNDHTEELTHYKWHLERVRMRQL